MTSPIQRVMIGMAAGALLALGYLASTPTTSPPSSPVTRALSEPATQGFARVLEPRPFQFPADHGPHPDFRHEWWYLTGNLATPTGRRFGYQFTLFRIGLTPTPPERPSPWAAHQIYLAHLAVSDPEQGTFHHQQRLARGAAGLAGVTAEPLRVWLEGWQLLGQGGDPRQPRLRLEADAGDFALWLELESLKPVVMQGDRGFSQKGRQPGNASYYYSLTRIKSAGEVRVGDASLSVTGTSWLDREWSTSALEPGQAGWDWFALHLADGREVMIYRMRQRDGSADAHSQGVLVDPDGTSHPLTWDEVELVETGRWASPRDGAPYPAGWELVLRTTGERWRLRPLLADQEWREASMRYWEGAVTLQDAAGTAVGTGYVELVGYGG